MTCLYCGKRMKRGQVLYVTAKGDEKGLCSRRCEDKYNGAKS